MAKRLAIPSKELELKLVGKIASQLIARIQSFDTNTDVPTTDVDELGNRRHVGQSQGIPDTRVSFSALDVGINLFSVLTGTDPDSYPAGGVDISELTEVDAILYVKSATIEDYVKTAHARRLQVSDFTFNYSLGGDSTEEYNLIGSEKRWFSNDVVVDKFTSGGTTFVLNDTAIQLKNGRWLLSVIQDGVYLEEVSAPATLSGTYSFNNGTDTITTVDTEGSQTIVVYQAAPAGTNWNDISDTEVPASIRGKDVNTVIAANNIPRVQSVTINGTMNVQPVSEMGSREIVGYQRQVPSVNGTLSVLDTDLELIDIFLNGSINSGEAEFQIGQGCTISGVELDIQLIDPCDTEAPYTVMKTVHVPDVVIVGESFSSSVNNNATQTFNWRSIDSQCIVYSGARS